MTKTTLSYTTGDMKPIHAFDLVHEDDLELFLEPPVHKKSVHIQALRADYEVPCAHRGITLFYSKISLLEPRLGIVLTQLGYKLDLALSLSKYLTDTVSEFCRMDEMNMGAQIASSQSFLSSLFEELSLALETTSDHAVLMCTKEVTSQIAHWINICSVSD